MPDLQQEDPQANPLLAMLEDGEPPDSDGRIQDTSNAAVPAESEAEEASSADGQAAGEDEQDVSVEAPEAPAAEEEEPVAVTEPSSPSEEVLDEPAETPAREVQPPAMPEEVAEAPVREVQPPELPDGGSSDGSGRPLVSALAAALGRGGQLAAALAEEEAAPQTPARTAEEAGGEEAGQVAPAPRQKNALPANGDTVEMVRPGTFNIHVKGADLRTVLKLLSTRGRRNIVATREVTGQVTADLYGVTFHEALDAVLKATGHVYREKDNFIYVYTHDQLKAVLQAERTMVTRVFHVAYAKPEDVHSLITQAGALSSQGKISVTPGAEAGIGSSNSSAGGDSYAADSLMVVRDYEENVEEIAKIIERVDVCPKQVLVEATILSCSLTDSNSLGVDFTTLSGVDFKALAGSGAGGEDGGGDAASVNPAGKLDSNFGDWSSTLFEAGWSTGGSGVTFGLVNGRTSLFIRALENVTDVTVLANPKLLVLNKQRGEVRIGGEEGYVTTTVTDTVATQGVEMLETGIKLVVRPYIGRDGQIRLEIHPEDSTGQTTAKGDFVLPEKTTTEVTTNLIVRDGRTIVIGGLFREVTNVTRGQVPIAGNLPVVGPLFRNKNDSTSREEVMILITPRIVQQDIDEHVGRDMKLEAQRQRIGARKGLHWWGSSRLAQTHVRWARQDLRKGSRRMALWNLDLALALNPRMVEAITLKERLTGKAYWAEEQRVSRMSHLVERMMMEEMGLPTSRVIHPERPLDARELPEKARERMGIRNPTFGPLPGNARAAWPRRNDEEDLPNSAGPDQPAEEPRQPAAVEPAEE